MSTDPENPTEIDLVGLGCDHQVLGQLEPKNLVKIGIFNKFGHFLRGFRLLVVSKQHGRIPNPENRTLWFLPDLQNPMGTSGAYQ